MRGSMLEEATDVQVGARYEISGLSLVIRTHFQ